jgi:N6-adenosine-specific RNA methylase IME4
MPVCWLSDDVVALDGDSDAQRACEYTVAVAPAWRLARPYGCETEAQLGEQRKRKKHKALADADPPLNAALACAAARHALALPALRRALLLYSAHAQSNSGQSDVPTAFASPCGDASLPALVAACEQGMPVTLSVVSGDSICTQPLVGALHVNDSDTEGVAHLGDAVYRLPPRCRFALSSAARLPGLLPTRCFTLLLVDPPWEAASVARSGCYTPLSPREVQALPVRALCDPRGALVALWVTNRERTMRHVEQKLLPAWGLSHVATWTWLKVCANGETVVPLEGGSAARRPYEVLLLCTSGPCVWQKGGAPPKDLVLLCPPAQHSRKPRLMGLLRDVAPEGAACELFARELTAGVCCWGNEPLRFQAPDCFTSSNAV